MLKIIFFKLSYTDIDSFIDNSFIHQHQMKLIFFCEILVYIISADGSNQRVLFVTAILCETKRISIFFSHWMLIRNE